MDDHPLIQSLKLLDAILIFLTKSSGRVSVPLSTLRRALPHGVDVETLWTHLLVLTKDHGVLHLSSTSSPTDWNSDCQVGFPPLSSDRAMSLHGSTKTAAKRRLGVLKKRLKQEEQGNKENGAVEDKRQQQQQEETTMISQKDWYEAPTNEPIEQEQAVIAEQQQGAAQAALNDLTTLLGLKSSSKDDLPKGFLPKQASFAGSFPSQTALYQDLSSDALQKIPLSLQHAFGLSSSVVQRRLYRHQAISIEAALNGQHVTICTGTGSGKSASFLLPVLSAAYNHGSTCIILFPTKALAQDQLTKLEALIATRQDLKERIRPATLDGDCPHSIRVNIAESANVILTNPDTLHAAILPGWKTLYKSMLAKLQYVVIDEAHLYEGVFGAHVAMILSRLVRVVQAAGGGGGVQFISASATLPWPEHHFRRLCPIPSDASITVVVDDASPRAAKHFFVWNPPILNTDGTCTGLVSMRKGGRVDKQEPKRKKPKTEGSVQEAQSVMDMPLEDSSASRKDHRLHWRTRDPTTYRRHAADETALLLAKAVSQGVRCIAFCKTRNLVEWVYERTIAALQRDPSTSSLVSKIESYRGGYSMAERRKIEQRLFRNELIGVVGTNALELGVDIGGIDLTLHCGYPSSYSSLLQQAGRAGRGAKRLDVPSCSVVICFNSPSEQHLWRHPSSLLSKGTFSPHSIPLNDGLVQAHLLCASEEFPLTGDLPVTTILGSDTKCLSDQDLFGGQTAFEEAVEELLSNGSVRKESIATPHGTRIDIFKAHPSMNKPWTRVSIRSIEPVSYSIVDISHPSQRGRMDAVYDQQSVMDTLPYSRVFYHAHPGAIITHRGRKYKVLSMTRPPAFRPENFGYRGVSLAAFAKPTSAKYLTRPLANLYIKVVKQLEHVELRRSERCDSNGQDKFDEEETLICSTLAGCGAVTVKRTVHGYKKLSLVTRVELSRSELSLPPLEYDTFGLWIDVEAERLAPLLGEKFGHGVHALSHALLAVAPLFAPGLVRSDLECDHSWFSPTRVMLFDERAGGSGACERLWKLLFKPNGILEAAIELLDDCSSCSQDTGYDGGCPACLHAPNCIKFNMHISRSAGVIIGRRMLERIKETETYQRNSKADENDQGSSPTEAAGDTPRRLARKRALRKAKDMPSARDRQFVVGRPTWPLDGDEDGGRQVHCD